MAYTKRAPQCDKCGGTEFNVRATEEPDVELVPASKYYEQKYRLGSTAMLDSRPYVAICNQCGAEYPFLAEMVY